jgi:hypothetical protein
MSKLDRNLRTTERLAHASGVPDRQQRNDTFVIHSSIDTVIGQVRDTDYGRG